MRLSLVLRLALAALLALAPVGKALAQEGLVLATDQGPNWTPERRAEFYGLDQGSKMMPLAWLLALRQANGQPFLADGLARYGYLPNRDDLNGLPIGFTTAGFAGAQTVGMTCAACHTRQIVAEGKAYRIDGGPAIADFQSFLSDIDIAVGNVLASDAAFAPFAASALGSASPDPAGASALRNNVQAWFLRYDALINNALPAHPWGPSRLDAISMIFDRVTGMDLGEPPSLLIPENIKPADAPVRYPFLWNAPLQDRTQWAGFANNGSDLLALSRNLGEVFGVFGDFQPKKNELGIINFLNDNSANFAGLLRNEQLIKQIGPPKWPWPVDAGKAQRGKTIFERPLEQGGGGCSACHDITPGAVRFPAQSTWATPVSNVNTDTRQYDVLNRTALTGVLQGFLVGSPLGQTEKAIAIVDISVLGSITERALDIISDVAAAAAELQANPLPFPLSSLPQALQELHASPPPLVAGAYEARVLQGIWAVAPYLHNGSVPTLAELLKPVAADSPARQRVAKFKIGPAYDTTQIGLAVDQPQSNFELETTDCSDRNSGNSRCGHEFGTTLSDEEKSDLLEYLKTL